MDFAFILVGLALVVTAVMRGGCEIGMTAGA